MKNIKLVLITAFMIMMTACHNVVVWTPGQALIVTLFIIVAIIVVMIKISHALEKWWEK
jgi:membrane protein YdbS with pleckstrin-like domain